LFEQNKLNEQKKMVAQPVSVTLSWVMSDPERPHADPTLTLAELAGRMGLAKSTVSRALSGTGRVSAATRERVRREAERLGYQPDPLLSAFSRYRRKNTTFRGAVVALVLPDQQTFKPNLNNHWCEPRGYRVEQFFLSDFQGSPDLGP